MSCATSQVEKAEVKEPIFSDSSVLNYENSGNWVVKEVDGDEDVDLFFIVSVNSTLVNYR